MVHHQIFLKLPEVLENEANSSIDSEFQFYNASDFLSFDSSKLVLPLVVVVFQCLVIAFICYKNIEEEENNKIEEVQQSILNESLLGGLNLIEVGLNYGTFANADTKSSS